MPPMSKRSRRSSGSLSRPSRFATAQTATRSSSHAAPCVTWPSRRSRACSPYSSTDGARAAPEYYELTAAASWRRADYLAADMSRCDEMEVRRELGQEEARHAACGRAPMITRPKRWRAAAARASFLPASHTLLSLISTHSFSLHLTFLCFPDWSHCEAARCAASHRHSRPHAPSLRAPARAARPPQPQLRTRCHAPLRLVPGPRPAPPTGTSRQQHRRLSVRPLPCRRAQLRAPAPALRQLLPTHRTDRQRARCAAQAWPPAPRSARQQHRRRRWRRAAVRRARVLSPRRERSKRRSPLPTPKPSLASRERAR